jgi:hypothetical protein
MAQSFRAHAGQKGVDWFGGNTREEWGGLSGGPFPPSFPPRLFKSLWKNAFHKPWGKTKQYKYLKIIKNLDQPGGFSTGVGKKPTQFGFRMRGKTIGQASKS